MKLTGLLKDARRFLSSNSPELLTAVGVVGTLTTAYLTGQASVKAYRLIDAAEAIQDRTYDGREILKATWKLYIPPAISAGLTVAAIITSNRVQNNRAAVMAAAYTVTERAYSQYREKVAETFGRDQEEEIRDEVAQDLVKRTPLGNREVIITGNGDHLCFDSATGRYFQSNMESLRRAENDINFQIINEGYASLSDFYYMVGLAGTSTSDHVGWNDKLDLSISPVLSDDNKPCLAINFDVEPKHRFDKFI